MLFQFYRPEQATFKSHCLLGFVNILVFFSRNSARISLSVLAILFHSNECVSDDLVPPVSIFERVAELVGEKRCDEAWNLIFPLVEVGNTDAALVASSLVVYTGLVPPGSPSDVLTLFRHGIILGMHGMRRDNDESLRHAKDLLMTITDRSVNGEILHCMDGDGDLTDCEAIAVTTGLIPEFTSYLEEMRRDAAKSSGAYCLSPSVMPQ